MVKRGSEDFRKHEHFQVSARGNKVTYWGRKFSQYLREKRTSRVA